MLIGISVLIMALLFGGMTFYSFAFAPYLFSVLSVEEARPLIRKAFPHFYLFVLVGSIAGVSTLAFVDGVSALILCIIIITVIYARQGLMPAINAATDSGNEARFKKLHGLSVFITLAHIIMSGYVIIRLLSFA